MGSFYYVGQINKQKYIEKEQQIKIEQQKQNQLIKEKETEINRQLLNNCLEDAEFKYLEWGKILEEKSKKCDTLISGEKIGCMEAYIEAFEKNDIQLQQDKNECFKKYPQE